MPTIHFLGRIHKCVQMDRKTVAHGKGDRIDGCSGKIKRADIKCAEILGPPAIQFAFDMDL